jgi:general stress protein 26
VYTEAGVAVAPTQVNLIFIANKASWKFDELANDSHVNVSFYEPSSTDWASFSGQAKIITDKAVIKKHWSHKCVILSASRE